MGAPARLALPDPSQRHSSLSSPVDSIFSPSESESGVPSSVSSTDSASSSFTRTFLYDGESTQKILTEAHLPMKKDLLAENVARKNKGTSKQSKQRPLPVCRSCCRCAGGFAADCAAVSCCPCAVFSLLAFMVVELPSAMGRKLVMHLQKRRCIKGSHSACSSRRGENSLSIFTPTRSRREPVEGGGERQAVSIIRFDTQNLLKHFEAEYVGFDCLSLKREEMVSDLSERQA